MENCMTLYHGSNQEFDSICIIPHSFCKEDKFL